MKKLFYFIIILISCEFSFAQNLVPNSSFEMYDTCPTNITQIQHLANWSLPLFGTTPDYFNACETFYPYYPNNIFGNEPARTGSGYAGLITVWNIPNPIGRRYREYLQVELTDSLTAGTNYYIQWYVSAADSNPYVSNNMGMYFSNVEIQDTNVTNYYVLNYAPQFENVMTNDLNNRIGWTKISGNYTAAGGEKYIIIGNFHDTTTTVFNPSGWSNTTWWAYYYVDDVCVATDSLYCNSPSGITEMWNEDDLILYPNPFKDKLNVTAKRNDPIEIRLYDVTSRKCLQQELMNSISLNTDQLSPGIYFYEVENKIGVIAKGKVVKY